MASAAPPRCQLPRRGATIGVNDLKAEFVERIVAAITAAGGRAIGLAENVATRDGMRRAVLGQEEAGRLDIMVNNAAWVRYQPLAEITPERWTAWSRSASRR